MDYQVIISQLLLIVAVLTALVNLVTEVVKNLNPKISGSKHINTFVLVLSVVLTTSVFLAYWQIKSMTITWYLIVAFILIGFIVAYAAMFGYDKFLIYLNKVKSDTTTLND